MNTDIPDVEEAPDVDLSRLFDISRIDEQLLQRQIQTCLQDTQGQVTLADVVSRYPVEFGLDEILTYVKLACEQDQIATIDESSSQMINWRGEAGNKQVKLPKNKPFKPQRSRVNKSRMSYKHLNNVNLILI